MLNEGSEEVSKLVEPIFPKIGVVALAGSSDTGKSTILQQLALSLVAGEGDFIGFKLNPTHNSVIFVSTEDDPNSVGVRLKKQNAGRYKADQLRGLRFVFEYDHLPDELDKELKKEKADCVIIDAFGDVFGSGDMNQVGSVRDVLNKFSKLATRHECLFVILHHTGKRTEALTPSKDNLVGSQGFEAKMRAVLILKKDLQDDALRHLCIVKGNYLSASEKEKSYLLRFNENLTFTNTEQRVHLSELSQNNVPLWYNRASALKKSGKTLRDISIQLKQEGFKNCAKSIVGEWLKDSKAETNDVKIGVGNTTAIINDSAVDTLDSDTVFTFEEINAFNPEYDDFDHNEDYISDLKTREEYI